MHDRRRGLTAHIDASEAVLQPIPETLEAITDLDAYEDDQHLLEDLLAVGEQIREVVPQCVGVTLAYLSEGISLTLVASSREIAVLDAIQYLGGELGGGPCVDAVAGEQVVEFSLDGLDEHGWQLFAQATAAAGIRSTLTLPIITGGRITGSVNMYASSGEAFVGHHEQLAAILGAWAPAAVTNADLEFSTRITARQAPRVLRERNIISNAVGRLMAAEGLGSEAAHQRLEQAAVRADVTTLELAEVMGELAGDKSGTMATLPAGAPEPLRIAIINDYDVVVEGLAALLAPFGDRVLLERFPGEEPKPGTVDVVLFDTFGQSNSAARITELGSLTRAKVLVYSWVQDQAQVDSALAAGAAGFLSKAVAAEELVAVVEAVGAGRVVVAAPALDLAPMEAWPGQTDGLSPRESEIVGFIVDGLKNSDIAEATYLSINSIKTYIRSAYKKMGVTSRPKAILWGLKHGFRSASPTSNPSDEGETRGKGHPDK